MPNASRQANAGSGRESVGRWEDAMHMYRVKFFLIQQEDREDERQQGLWYKLKSLWIHHINMIMRAMCGQSMFNSLSGGLLAPRGFLILLSKDWKLLILPLLYQGDVFRNKWAANCLQRIRTGKTTDHSILHRQRNPPQWPTMCTTGLLPTDNFQEQHALPRGFSLVSLCPTSTMHF